jgi:hypothetical protein
MRKIYFESLERREMLHGEHFATPHDSIPLFGHNGVDLTAGSWSSDGGDVRIPAGITVTVDDLTATARNVFVEGTLLFNPSIDTRLLAETILVMPTGRLEIRPNEGVSAEIVIDDAPIDLTADPEEYGHGLLVLGSIDVEGADKTDFARLAVEPRAGDGTLTFSEPVVGWEVGDEVVLPDTRQLTLEDGSYFKHPKSNKYVRLVNAAPQDERLTIASVSDDGLTVGLKTSLAYDHVGARDADGVLRFLPHAANMTRNVVIRSENSGGVRGHFFATDDAQVEIENAAFVELGRTTVELLGPENQIGRYAIHLHHLDNTAPYLTNGERFLVSGSVVDGSPKWGIAIHDTHYGRISDNVVFNAVGSGIVQEDGSETGNEFLYNFVLRNNGSMFDIDDGPVNRRPGQATASADEVGHEGAGFWLRSWNETVLVGNVAVGAQERGFSTLALGTSDHVPLAPGVSGVRKVKLQSLAPAEFHDNEVYGGTPTALNPWFQAHDQLVVENFVAWHIIETGYQQHYTSGEVTIEGLTVLFDPTRPPGRTPRGTSTVTDVMASNVEIFGADVGITHNPSNKKTDSISRYEHLRLENRIDFLMVGGAAADRLRRTEIVDAVFNGTVGLKMEFDPFDLQPSTKSILAKDVVSVQFAGDEYVYRAWYDAQRAEALVPAARYKLSNGKLYIDGAPQPGMSNDQLFSEIGTAIGGEVMDEAAFQVDNNDSWFSLARGSSTEHA